MLVEEIKIPEDLLIKLIEEGLFEKFQTMPPSHKKEYIKWIDEAKKEETRKQ